MSESWFNALIGEGAQFSDGRVVGFSGTSAESAMAASSGICDLSHYGLVKISGEDAAQFLHAQFTNDVLALQSGQSQLNGWCSPKGRLLAVFWLWRIDDEYYMLLQKSLQLAIQKRLGMFILRSKVTLEDVSATTVRIGLLRASPAPGTDHPYAVDDILSSFTPAPGNITNTDRGTSARLGPSRTVLVTSPATAEAVWKELCKTLPPLTVNEWDLAGINEGVIEVVPDTQDSYVPQMANLELVGGVSFKKGCYPGQEIVARTQYRGILKRRMAKVSHLSSIPLKPGTPVYSPQYPDQSVGSVALSARSSTSSVVALVVVQLESINSNSLYLDIACTRENQLPVSALPYVYPD
jgi:folate-binding protein YgfZ